MFSVPGWLEIKEDVDHCAVALPELAAVTLHFDPEQQQYASVPAGIQVDPEVALPACIKRGRGDKKNVEFFERLAVNILSSRVILVSDFEARVHTNLWPFQP